MRKRSAMMLPKRAHISTEQCLNVLEIMAMRGWLNKPAWYLYKAVHALVKNISVSLTNKTSYAVVQGLKKNSVGLQVAGNLTAPLPPLQLGLRELTLCRGFVHDVGPLPATLASLRALDWPASEASSLATLLLRLPEQLQSLALGGTFTVDVSTSPLIAGQPAGLPAAVPKVRTPLLTALLKLELIRCCLGEELRTPATLLQLHITQSSWAPVATTSLMLNEGLQELQLMHATALTLSDPLPSTLQTLLVRGPMQAALQALPAGLRSLRTSAFNHALCALPDSLTDLYVGNGGLGLQEPVLPSSLTSLTVASSWCLAAAAALPQQLVALDVSFAPGFSFAGELPLSLQRLRCPKDFDQPLGRLPEGLLLLDLQHCEHFNHPLGPLPADLRELRLGAPYDRPLAGQLPLSLKKLYSPSARRYQQRALSAVHAGLTVHYHYN
jgi:hypothetical protein